MTSSVWCGQDGPTNLKTAFLGFSFSRKERSPRRGLRAQMQSKGILPRAVPVSPPSRGWGQPFPGSKWGRDRSFIFWARLTVFPVVFLALENNFADCCLLSEARSPYSIGEVSGSKGSLSIDNSQVLPTGFQMPPLFSGYPGP